MKKENRIKSLVCSILFFTLTLTVVFGVVYSAKYIGTNMNSKNMPINKVENNNNKLALTFDISWGDSNIYEILDLLDKHKVKASFFLVGNWVDENKEIVEEIHKRGHDIGSHSNTHANMTQISDEDLKKELSIASDKIEAITGERPTMYRPPFGDFDNDSLKICEELGYTTVKWDIDSFDWKEIGTNHVVDRVLKSVDSGSIVLFHGDVKNNKQYLDIIIRELKKEHDIVPLSKLLYNEGYEIDSNGIQRKK
ncbi:polysaccharide deacetylase family protein [Paraclostridium bifermentans]|uniref:polysaccharide deacetylase family protein n=1 Tax=Paraclostridium bifermentans TaxID=1490 RepID=UPI00359C9BD7